MGDIPKPAWQDAPPIPLTLIRELYRAFRVLPVVILAVVAGGAVSLAIGDSTALEYTARVSLFLVVIDIKFSWRNRKVPPPVVQSYSRSPLSRFLCALSLVLMPATGFFSAAL